RSGTRTRPSTARGGPPRLRFLCRSFTTTRRPTRSGESRSAGGSTAGRRSRGLWQIQFRGCIIRRQELSEFSFTPLKDNASVARYGHLTGLGSVQAGNHLERLPYATVRSEHFQSDPNDPFRDGSDQFPAAGVDLKYGLT